ncbi:hypothetical protein HaLaN_30122 [Haematococcus lacustris]|uniref:Uncharacterized protein n=1 Tax=Haematococcus lacustris TaxID=44745 RepID=A0A6A0AE24_HAELA|nr:hypothetical protein HaLaN_30122 [Haematococcus lacustris]
MFGLTNDIQAEPVGRPALAIHAGLDADDEQQHRALQPSHSPASGNARNIWRCQNKVFRYKVGTTWACA